MVGREKIKILYIFTSGDFDSANNKKWFDLLYGDEHLEVLVLIRDCSEAKKNAFKLNYGDYFKTIYFKTQSELFHLNLHQRFIYLKEIAKQIEAFDTQIIHLQGLFYTYMVMPLFFVDSNFRLVFNIWGSDFNIAYRQKFKNRLIFRYLMRKSTLVWVNWFSMKEELQRTFPRHQNKIKTLLWGVEDSLFQPPSKETRKKIRKKFNLKHGEYVFLYTRAFVDNSNHLKILRAIARLKTNTPFKFIFHNKNSHVQLLKEIENFIHQNRLNDKVVLSRSSLSSEEIQALYAESDVVLSLTTRDQLSRTTFEAILSDSHLIVNENSAYRFLKEVFDFNIYLVDVNDRLKLKEIFEFFVEHKPKTNWEYEKTVIKRLFRFETKKERFLRIYAQLIEKDLAG